MKLILTILIALSAGFAQAKTYNYLRDVRTVRRSIANMDQLDMAGKIDASLDGIVSLAADQLIKAGQKDEATRITTEYEAKFQGYITALITERMQGLGDIGDHRPLSAWLTELYNRLYALLGPEIMAFTHLEDIKTFNYGIPVFLHLQGVSNQEINAAEYSLHFIPLMGCITYWTVWGVCTGATWGTMAFVVCSPAGLAGKYIVVKYIAPKFTDNAYEYFYGPDFKKPSHPMEDRIGCIGINVLDFCKQ